MKRIEFDKLGNRCKEYEMAEAGRKAMPGVPLLARLDGRAFHSYTKGLDRPYDANFGAVMIETASALVKEFHAATAYTQSDEITLVWPLFDSQAPTEYPFGGRFQKIQSVLSAYASVVFARAAQDYLPSKSDNIPVFDCRVWQVPAEQDVVDVFLWRQADAEKNSVQMAARSVASHKELHGKGRKHQHDLLHAHGLNWNNYPAHQKRGVFLKRCTHESTLDEATLEKIPLSKRPAPGSKVVRTRIEVREWQLTKSLDLAGTLLLANELTETPIAVSL